MIDLSARVRSNRKRQNLVLLLGHVVGYTWRVEEVVRDRSGFVLETEVRTDRRVFGGHHRVLVLNALGMQLLTLLELFAEAQEAPGHDLEQLAPHQLDEHYLALQVGGYLRGDEGVVATEVTYLNVPLKLQEEARRRRHAMVAERKA